MERRPLDAARLAPESRLVLARLRLTSPELFRYALMEEDTGGATHHLLLHAPSPTGDATQDACLWMECGDEPSVGFGHTHRHFDIQGDPSSTEANIDRALALFRGIVEDRRVLLYDGVYPGSVHAWIVDREDEDAIMDMLSGPDAPSQVSVRTWSGGGDRDVVGG